MNRDAKKIVETFASAIASTWNFSPAAMKEAAKYITSPAFSADPDDREIIASFVGLLQTRADNKEASYRSAFGPT